MWHDGTERPSHRPPDPEDQQAFSRGKKKGHTLTHRLVSEETCHRCFWSAPEEGKANETNLAALEGSTRPHGRGLSQERGSQGCILKGSTMAQPKTTPPGAALTPPEKATTRARSSIRLRLEHALGGVKRARIVKDNSHLLKDGMRAPSMETGCGLHNVRRQYRPWHYAL